MVLHHVDVVARRQRGVGVADPVVVVAALLHRVLHVDVLAVGGDLEVLGDAADVGVRRVDPVEEPVDPVPVVGGDVHGERLDDVEITVLVDREVGLVDRDRGRITGGVRGLEVHVVEHGGDAEDRQHDDEGERRRDEALHGRKARGR